MAAIAPKLLGLVAAVSLAFISPLEADQAADVQEQLLRVADSLTAGNPADAMVPFSRDFADYGRLSDYFTGLTNAFAIVNEINILSEQDSKEESIVVVHWAISLSGAESNVAAHRAADIHVRLIPDRKNKWRIVEFTPVSIFDPAESQQPGGSPGL